MEKFMKYLILIVILLSKQSISIRCINNYCDCNELKNEVKCTNNNKESIAFILNELTTNEIKSLDLSFNNLKDNEIQEILSDYNLESIKELNIMVK
jgi:hypothetical protein